MSQYPISPTPLIPSIPIHKPSLSIQLKTPKYILRPRHPSKIRRIPRIANMNIATPSRPTHSALCASAAGSVAKGAASAAVGHAFLFLTREESAAGAQGGAGLGGEESCLGLHFGVGDGVFADDVVQDGEEVVIFFEGLGRGWELGA